MKKGTIIITVVAILAGAGLACQPSMAGPVTTATLNPFPFVGSASGGVQILYDIFDPFIPWG